MKNKYLINIVLGILLAIPYIWTYFHMYGQMVEINWDMLVFKEILLQIIVERSFRNRKKCKCCGENL